MARLGEKYARGPVVAALTQRLELANKRAHELRDKPDRRSYWSGEITGLEYALELLEETVGTHIAILLIAGVFGFGFGWIARSQHENKG